MTCVIGDVGDAPRNQAHADIGVVGVQPLNCKRVSFWRQMGSRLIQSVGEKDSGLGFNNL